MKQKKISFFIFAKHNKKAFIRILESLIAITIMFIFLTYFIHSHTFSQRFEKTQSQDILKFFENNNQFRYCVSQENTTCLEQILKSEISKKYNYKIIVSEDPFAIPQDLPRDKQIYTDSLIIFEDKFKIVKLYYWIK